MEIFQDFVTMFSKSSAADLLYVGKGQTSDVVIQYVDFVWLYSLTSQLVKFYNQLNGEVIIHFVCRRIAVW